MCVLPCLLEQALQYVQLLSRKCRPFSPLLFTAHLKKNNNKYETYALRMCVHCKFFEKCITTLTLLIYIVN